MVAACGPGPLQSRQTLGGGGLQAPLQEHALPSLHLPPELSQHGFMAPWLSLSGF